MSLADQRLFDENMNILSYLKESRIFSNLPDETLKKLLPLSNLVEYPSGFRVLEEGQINHKVFFLIKGRVDVYSSGELILRLRRRGDIFGEMSVISDRPCAATVITDGPVHLFSIQSRNIGKYSDLNPEKIQNVLFRLFSMILTEKLLITTKKAKQYESTNKRLKETQNVLRDAHLELGMQLKKLQETTISKDFFNNTIQSMMNTLMVISPIGTIQLANQATLDLLEYEESEIIGMHYKDIFVEKEFFRMAIIDDLQTIFSIVDVEAVYRTKTGRDILMLFSGSVIKNDFDEIQGYVCVAQDISERKAMEEDLEASRASFHNIVEQNEDGAVILDKQGHVRYLNKASALILGEHRDELLDNLFADSLQSVRVKEIEVPHSGKPNGFVEIRITATQWEGEGAFLLSIRDITQRKTIEVELQDAKEELENSNHYLTQLNQVMTSELEQARQTQQSLFPQVPPSLPGCKLARKCIQIEQIGGDFYDFVSYGEDKVGILIADVAGHGVPAALVSFMASGLFKTYAPQDDSPSKTIQFLNHSLFRKLPEDKFVSAFYCVYDQSTKVLRYIAAGHPPAYVVRNSTQEVVPLVSKGVLLGVLANEKIDFKEYSFQLIPGDRLFIYTDGLVENYDASRNFFGQERLKASLKEHGHLGIEALLEEIHKSVVSFLGNRDFSDDLTMVGLEIQ